METLKKYLLLFLGGALVIWSFYAFLNSPAPAHYQSAPTLKIGEQIILVEIANTDEKRSLGLSGRDILPEGQGLLFIFEIPGSYGFWMKDMKFPIDIVWIDEEWQVIGVEREVSPESFPTTYLPPRSVKYVLELNSGEASRLGIDVGSRVSPSR